MSKTDARLVSQILKPFGNVVERIGLHLSEHGAQTIPALAQSLLYPLKTLKEGLFILVHHGLVCEASAKYYSLDTCRLELRLYYPLWVQTIKSSAFGELAANILLQVLVHTKVPYLTLRSMFGGTLREVEETIHTMIQSELLIVAPSPKEDSSELMMNVECPTHPDYALFYSAADKRRAAALATASASPSKRVKRDLLVNDQDFITFHAARLHSEYFSAALVEYVAGRLNAPAGRLLQLVFDLMPARTEPVFVFSMFQLAQRLPAGLLLPVEPAAEHQGHARLREYLMNMCRISRGFLSVTGDRSGQSASLSFKYDAKRAHELLCGNTLEGLIQNKFGIASARIFRLLESKTMLEEKQIHKMAMTGLKETREKLFQLFHYGLVQLQEVPRTPDHAPSRTAYLWKFDETQTKQMMLRILFKSYINCLERMKHERLVHQLLLAKAEHVASSQQWASETSEIQAHATDNLVLNDAEKRQLSLLMKKLDRLEASALSLTTLLLKIKACS